MKTLHISLVLTTITLIAVSSAYGQRGRGETEGLARQGLQPEMVEITGTLDRAETGPCPRTTGRAYIGTHLFIKQDDGTMINLHVGSADAVKPFVDKLEVGQPIQATGFRTERLEKSHYVAKDITADGETLNVRADDLSPFWAQQRGDRRERRDRDMRRGDRRDRPGYGRR